MKLKPCPFCGGKASYMTYITERGVFIRSRKYIYFKCKNCEAQTKAFPESVHYSAEEKAMEAWNKRVGEEDENR